MIIMWTQQVVISHHLVSDWFIRCGLGHVQSVCIVLINESLLIFEFVGWNTVESWLPYKLENRVEKCHNLQTTMPILRTTMARFYFVPRGGKFEKWFVSEIGRDRWPNGCYLLWIKKFIVFDIETNGKPSSEWSS